MLALGLIGGGMGDRAADALVASWGPDQNLTLRGAAQRLMGVTFMPQVMAAKVKKPPAVSGTKPEDLVQPDTTLAPLSATSAA